MSCALISEELSYGCSGIQTILEGNGLAQAPLILSGSEFLKNKYLTRCIDEPVMASYCEIWLRLSRLSDKLTS